MKKNVQLITVGAVTLALTAVLGMVPYIFLVPLLFTCVTRDWKLSVVSSLFFGLISYLYSFMGGSVVAIAFLENPWIPIVPRLFVGLIAHGTYVLCRKLLKGQGRVSRVLPVSLAASAGSIANTALVIPCLLLFASDATFGDMTMPLYLATMLINGAIELAAVNLLVPPLAFTVGRALRLPDYIPVKKAENASVPVSASAETK